MNSTKTNGDSPCSKTSETEEDRKKKNGYIYESRHLHAARRLRGKDGKFLASTIFSIQLDPKVRDSERRKKEEENQKTKLHNFLPIFRRRCDFLHEADNAHQLFVIFVH